MLSWLVASILVLFQPSQVIGQAFTVTVSPVRPLPSGVGAKAIAYDEPNQFFYLGGTAATSIDSQPFGGVYDFFVSKHFMNGTRVWARLAGGAGNDSGNKMVRVPETGDVFIFGMSDSFTIDNQAANGRPDTVVVKFAQNGTKLFVRYFGRIGTCDSGDGFVSAQMNQLIIGGYYNGFVGFTGIDMNNGTMMRQNVLTVVGRYFGMAPIVGSSSDCYGTGTINGVLDGQPYSGGDDVLLVKLNYLNGTRYWTRTWGNVTEDRGADVQYDASSGLVFVGGYTFGTLPFNGLPAFGDKDAILICTSYNGTYLWTRRFGTSSTDQINTIGVHPSTGTLFATGYYSNNNGFISALSQNGSMQQFYLSSGSANYQDIVFSSDATLAYVCDSGNLLTLNISLAPSVAMSSTVVSNLVPSSTLISASIISTPRAVLTTALSTSESQNAPQSSSYRSIVTSTTALLVTAAPPLTSIFTATVSDNVRNVPSAPASSFLQSMNLMVVVLLIVCVVLFAGLISTCLCFTMRQRKGKLSDVHTTFSATSDTTAFSQITSSTPFQQTTSTTLIRGYFELSLPGYLMFDSRKSFRLTRQIAKGGGGVVSLAEAFSYGLAVYGSTIIVKTVGFNSGTSLLKLSELYQKSFKQEISIMHYFREERNIAKLLGWSNDPACILMKFYPLGSLDKWIHGNAYKSKLFQVQCMKDISLGVLAMHNAGFVHCDLKPQNVLVDEDEHGQLYCCLTDFGIAQVVDETSLLVKDFAVSRLRGLSVQYAAPEAFERFRSRIAPESVPAELMLKLDLYSLGAIMDELLERRLPWGHET